MRPTAKTRILRYRALRTKVGGMHFLVPGLKLPFDRQFNVFYTKSRREEKVIYHIYYLYHYHWKTRPKFSTLWIKNWIKNFPTFRIFSRLSPVYSIIFFVRDSNNRHNEIFPIPRTSIKSFINNFNIRPWILLQIYSASTWIADWDINSTAWARLRDIMLRRDATDRDNTATRRHYT